MKNGTEKDGKQKYISYVFIPTKIWGSAFAKQKQVDFNLSRI